MKNFPWKKAALVTFFIGLFGELAMQTFFRHKFGNDLSPAIWLASGLLTSISAWILLVQRKTTIPTYSEIGKPVKNVWLVWSIFLLVAGAFAYQLKGIFAEFEVSQYNSDIVPSIQMYVRRLLSGETVYKPLVFDGWTVLPTYFPMMWLPYCFSEILDIDYRWTAYLVFLGALGLYVYRLNKQTLPIIEKIIKVLLPFAVLWVFASYNKEVFGHAVELLPIAFYLLLCFFLFHHRKPWMFAISIVFCLLSRYAFTLWLPLIMLIFWVEYGFKPFLKVSLFVLAGVSVIYIIPFLSKNWSLVTDGLSYYEKTAIRQWSPQAWQAEGEKPYHLFQGLSFTAWFYDTFSGDAQAKMDMNKLAHAIVSFGAAAFLGAMWLILRKKLSTFNVRLYCLVGLKFYLMFFYGFIYVPFGYLFMLPLFLSFALVFEIPMVRHFRQ